MVWGRKAQNLVADLHVRFGGQDERFRFSDLDQLSADSGSRWVAGCGSGAMHAHAPRGGGGSVGQHASVYTLLF